MGRWHCAHYDDSCGWGPVCVLSFWGSWVGGGGAALRSVADGLEITESYEGGVSDCDPYAGGATCCSAADGRACLSWPERVEETRGCCC